MRRLSADELREDLRYDPATGLFTRLRATSRRVKIGDIAGSRQSSGHIVIMVRGRTYPAAQLAWLYVHGDWATGIVDHINTDPGDNRIDNLRDIPRASNVQNQRRPHRQNRNGIPGVEQLASGRWRARINVGGKYHHLGVFETADEASDAYLVAKRSLHPYFSA